MEGGISQLHRLDVNNPKHEKEIWAPWLNCWNISAIINGMLSKNMHLHHYSVHLLRAHQIPNLVKREAFAWVRQVQSTSIHGQCHPVRRVEVQTDRANLVWALG